MVFLSSDFLRDVFFIAYLSVAVLVVLVVTVILWRVNPEKKWVWALIPATILGFAYPPVSALYGKWQDDRKFVAKSAAQIAHFEMRCKGAGEKIHRVVKGVDGVFIMKPRIVPTETLQQSQWELWDPYGTDSGEAWYPQILLFGVPSYAGARGDVSVIGFRFIETFNKEDSRMAAKYSRHLRTGKIDPTDSLDQLLRKNVVAEPVDVLASRFGITWDDISTRSDRENWVAGGRVQVIELATGNVLAERVGYMREPGLGDRRRNRSAWQFATAFSCPEIVSAPMRDRDLLAKVFRD